MRRDGRGRSGQSVLYTIVLAPIIFLSLAMALEAGALQMQKERLHSAADMATTSAGSMGAVVAPDVALDTHETEHALRTALLANMSNLSDDIAGSTPYQVAMAADVYVITAVPSVDPLDTARTLTRPTVETRLRVPVRSGLLSFAGLPPQVTLTVDSTADLRVIGGTQA